MQNLNDTTNSIIKHFNGKKIRIDPTNNYPNLTDMARASGKKVAGFLRLDSTKDFIQELSGVVGNHTSNLLCVGDKSTGTWAHPQIAIKFAGWLSAKFEVLMTSWIFELLSTGKVDLALLPEPQALLFEGDNDLASNMAMAIAPRLLSTENDSEARLGVSPWQTITEMLASLGHPREKGSIAVDTIFRNWLNKDFSGLFRSRNGTRPPRVKTKRGCPYCYPSAYISLLEAYLNSYVANFPIS